MKYFKTTRAAYGIISTEFGTIAEAHRKNIEFRVGQFYNQLFYDPKAQKVDEELTKQLSEGLMKHIEELPELKHIGGAIGYAAQVVGYGTQGILAGILYLTFHPRDFIRANIPLKHKHQYT